MDELKQTGVSENKNSFTRKAGRFFRKILIAALLIGILAIYWFFFNKYSDGERKGTLIKITRKGNIFKTHEGEMWLSCRQTMNPEKFYFSVTNDSIANVMKVLQDECVQVTYVQYRATLPWRGDSKYIVTGVIPIRQQNQ
ncbi:MAG: hypothetical protein JNK14_10425 [Chitinophagaceae bacterium]|nr:hypothetical protein [Chitinophagaceae bacterium]